jgi:hypothetical protein
MKIGLSLTFKKYSLDGEFHIAMVNKYLRYKPESFAWRKEVKGWKEKKWDEKKHKELIEGLTSSETFILSSSDGNAFSVNDVEAVKKPYQHFRIVQDNEVFNPANSEIGEVISREGFSCAYLYDEEYETQQSALCQNRVLVYGNSALFRRFQLIKNDLLIKVYNILSPPGRSHMISSTDLLACWKMWFGKEFYHIVPKERLLSFKDAYKIEELANDVVYVQLFEKVADSATRKGQRIQRKWRKWLNFDDLIKRHP